MNAIRAVRNRAYTILQNDLSIALFNNQRFVAEGDEVKIDSFAFPSSLARFYSVSCNAPTQLL